MENLISKSFWRKWKSRVTYQSEIFTYQGENVMNLRHHTIRMTFSSHHSALIIKRKRQGWQEEEPRFKQTLRKCTLLNKSSLKIVLICVASLKIVKILTKPLTNSKSINSTFKPSPSKSRDTFSFFLTLMFLISFEIWKNSLSFFLFFVKNHSQLWSTTCFRQAPSRLTK